MLERRGIRQLAINVAAEKLFDEQVPLEQNEFGGLLVVRQMLEKTCHVTEHAARTGIVSAAHS